MTEPAPYQGKRLSAKEVLRLYAAGERNFRGAILRGCSFYGISLLFVDFSNADIRGTTFEHSNLSGTRFAEVLAGTQQIWVLFKFSSVWLLLTASNFIVSVLSTIFLDTAYADSILTTDTKAGDLLYGLAALLSLPVILMFIYLRGVITSIGTSFLILVISGFVGIFFGAFLPSSLFFYLGWSILGISSGAVSYSLLASISIILFAALRFIIIDESLIRLVVK